MTRALVLAGALLLALPALAHAQACADGRVASAETAGRCCWPGQRWSDAAGRCEGPPACPGGRVPEGDTCVPGAAPATGTAPPIITPVAPSVAPGPASVGPATDTVAWPAAHPRAGAVNPRRSLSPDTGWIAAGSSVLAVGYLGAVIIASIQLGDDAVCVERAGYEFIPIAGPFIHLGVTLEPCGTGDRAVEGDFRWPDLIPGSLQVVGLLAIVLAAALPNTPSADWDEALRVGEARLVLRPVAPGADIGGTSLLLAF